MLARRALPDRLQAAAGCRVSSIRQISHGGRHHPFLAIESLVQPLCYDLTLCTPHPIDRKRRGQCMKTNYGEDRPQNDDRDRSLAYQLAACSEGRKNPGQAAGGNKTKARQDLKIVMSIEAAAHCDSGERSGKPQQHHGVRSKAAVPIWISRKRFRLARRRCPAPGVVDRSTYCRYRNEGQPDEQSIID